MSAATVGPLTGKRIVVTRSPEMAEMMGQKLAALGAKPICLPVIDFVPLPAPELDRALTHLSQYDWLIFTSANAVRFFFDRLDTVDSLNNNYELPFTNSRLRTAAVGQATARLLAEKRIDVDFVPEEFTGQQLALGLGNVDGRRILLPRARIGRPEISALLREQGAVVDEFALYDTVTADPDQSALIELEKGVDVITFTSPSSVRNLVEILRNNSNVDDTDLGRFGRIFFGPLIACIGPSTAEEAAEQGLTVDIVPEEYTIDGLIAAVAAYFEDNTER
jgi:uroporphyrinogen-III synthase